MGLIDEKKAKGRKYHWTVPLKSLVYLSVQVLSRDSVTVSVEAVVYYRVNPVFPNDDREDDDYYYYDR